MDVPANGCDAYVDKTRKDCNDLVVELHPMCALSDELLLHTNGRITGDARSVVHQQNLFDAIHRLIRLSRHKLTP